MPYSQYQQGPQQAPYNPFDPMQLYVPMSRDIDQSNARQASLLREQFGKSGTRYGSSMMGALGNLNRDTAADKAKLMSQLQYQGAQDTYGRQKDAADRNLQLGTLQNQMAGQSWNMGQEEQQAANADLQAQLQEWLRTNQGYLPQLLSLLGAGQQGDFMRQNNWIQDWGPFLAKVAGDGADYYTKNYGGQNNNSGGEAGT